MRAIAAGIELLALLAAAPTAVPRQATQATLGQLRPIRYVRTKAPALALTFDACPRPAKDHGFDRAVFDLIQRERLPVTIFVSGRWVDTHPDAMQALVAEPLVEFGDHSYHHPHMTKLGAPEIRQEIDRTEAALARYGKKSVAFRPPFGSWSRVMMDVAGARRLPTVTWDVVSGDPNVRTSAEKMTRAVVGKARPGSIIVFHINGRGVRTAEALPEILRGLRARGFQFLPLSALLASGKKSAP